MKSENTQQPRFQRRKSAVERPEWDMKYSVSPVGGVTSPFDLPRPSQRIVVSWVGWRVLQGGRFFQQKSDPMKFTFFKKHGLVTINYIGTEKVSRKIYNASIPLSNSHFALPRSPNTGLAQLYSSRFLRTNHTSYSL